MWDPLASNRLNLAVLTVVALCLIFLWLVLGHVVTRETVIGIVGIVMLALAYGMGYENGKTSR